MPIQNRSRFKLMLENALTQAEPCATDCLCLPSGCCSHMSMSVCVMHRATCLGPLHICANMHICQQNVLSSKQLAERHSSDMRAALPIESKEEGEQDMWRSHLQDRNDHVLPAQVCMAPTLVLPFLAGLKPQEVAVLCCQAQSLLQAAHVSKHPWSYLLEGLQLLLRLVTTQQLLPCFRGLDNCGTCVDQPELHGSGSSAVSMHAEKMRLSGTE